ncbi:alpha/beta hydrolase [Nocardia sp. NBC_01377]|uniref:alpha/beta hydrolase n=1 Tax=Nocardia sp. NBC_01377 TaxID=2903595 RepID=UPI00324D365E
MTIEKTPVTTEDRTVTGRHGDFRVRDYRPAVTTTNTPMVWVHGGGFGSGDLDMPESHAVATAIASTGRPVTTVDYRLVPAFALIGRFRLKPSTNRYPVPLDDVTDAVLDTVGRHPGRAVILGGASAGACLAASATMRVRQDMTAAPTGLLLVYGLFHAQLPALSANLRPRLRGIARLGAAPEIFRRMTMNYVGTDELFADPAVFPGTADVRGFPPTLLLDADRDALRASSEAFADHLRAVNVPLSTSVIPETRHGFLNKPGSRGYPEAIATMTDWLSHRDRN